jgi:APA family basic amino acid/polyamine antiporter
MTFSYSASKMNNKKKNSLNRDIGQLGFAAIALNGVIGAGIFALPAVAAAKSGYFSPWLFLICAVLIMTVVLSFARAASFFRETGGPIQYAGQAFGPFAGFQTGWLVYIGRLAAIGANISLMVTYAGWFWTPLESGLGHQIAVAVTFLLLAVFNAVGVRQSMGVVFLFSALKLVPLFLLIVMGLAHIQPEILIQGQLPVSGTLGETVLILLYAFVGFESAVVPAGEARNPRKDIPRAITITVLIITGVYFLIQLISVSVLPELADSKTPLADVAEVLIGASGAALLTLGAVFSIGGNCSASMLSAPRMTYALAQLGSLPAWFGEVHPRTRTPLNSILFYAVLGLVLALSGSFIWLAVVSTLARLLSYILGVAALPILEKQVEKSEKHFKLRGGYFVPALALILCLWLVTFASLTAWLTTAAFFALGSILYLVSSKNRKGMSKT